MSKSGKYSTEPFSKAVKCDSDDNLVQKLKYVTVLSIRECIKHKRFYIICVLTLNTRAISFIFILNYEKYV